MVDINTLDIDQLWALRRKVSRTMTMIRARIEYLENKDYVNNAIPNFFMDLCRERMYPDTFTEYLEEAKKRREQKKGVV